MKMMTPTIHTNGTDPETLLDLYMEAGSRLNEALRAMSAAAPNARDYYPQGDDAFRCAVDQHESRCALVRRAKDEIGGIMAFIMELE